MLTPFENSNSIVSSVILVILYHKSSKKEKVMLPGISMTGQHILNNDISSSINFVGFVKILIKPNLYRRNIGASCALERVTRMFAAEKYMVLHLNQINLVGGWRIEFIKC